MSEVADDMVNGSCCELCGMVFNDGRGEPYDHGYPVVCWQCWVHLTEKEREVHQRALMDTF